MYARGFTEPGSAHRKTAEIADCDRNSCTWRTRGRIPPPDGEINAPVSEPVSRTAEASVSKAERKPLLRKVFDNPRHADPATLSTVTLSSVPTAVDTERNIIPAE